MTQISMEYREEKHIKIGWSFKNVAVAEKLDKFHNIQKLSKFRCKENKQGKTKWKEMERRKEVNGRWNLATVSGHNLGLGIV